MGDTLTAEQEKQVKRVKRVVEGWRVVVLQLRAVLLWEQLWHPAAIVGTLCTLHLLVWLCDPNSLTLLASVGILVNVMDVCVPLVMAQLVPASAWGGAQERQLEDLCRAAVVAWGSLAAHVAAFAQLRSNKPLVYYALSVSGLLLLLYVGKSVNNGRLAFAALLAAGLLPGALHRGLPAKLQAALGGVVPGKKQN